MLVLTKCGDGRMPSHIDHFIGDGGVGEKLARIGIGLTHAIGIDPKGIAGLRLAGQRGEDQARIGRESADAREAETRRVVAAAQARAVVAWREWVMHTAAGRLEINVVELAGSDQLNTRTEIKNLNSFRALTLGTEYEIQRQSEIQARGGSVEQETLGFNESTGKTYSQRGKESAHDYRYFPEPDLPPLVLDSAWIQAIRASLPELPEAKMRRFIDQYGLTSQEARLLTSEKLLADYFEEVVSKSKSPAKMISSWIAGEFMRYMNDMNLEVAKISIAAEDLAQLIDMVLDKTVSGSSGKVVLAEMFKNGGKPEEIVKARNLAQVSDESFIQEAVTKVLNDNSSEVEKYLAGKDTLLQWFIGQISRATKGKADPNVAKELLIKGFEERRK